jgi:DNA-binding transcriptional MerR regulator
VGVSRQRNKVPSDTGGGISLTQLAKKCGVPERTIRYYITRGLIPGPVRGGRDAEYTQEHLAGIEAVRRMQALGLTLAEIEYKARKTPGNPQPVGPESWWLYPVSPDVTVQVRSGLSPWRVRRVKSAIARLAAELNDPQENGEE